LLPLAEVITPNLDEAAALTGLPVRDDKEVQSAARRLHGLGARGVVITGGHRDEAIDLLSLQGRMEEFRSGKIESRSTHGTGCAFSTAIACELANGAALREAVVSAKEYVRRAIERAVVVGRGVGPLKLI
jgi:hydroxymethylpyrimidine/phosphomethylpyrimidine kinase